MATQDNDYTTKVQEYNRNIWDNILRLKALQTQWNKLNYANTLEVQNPELTAADYGAVVFASADALMAVIESGVGGNMAKLL